MSYSGLNKSQRAIARDRTVNAAILALHHAPDVHYTQGPKRWQGIDEHLVARHGNYPKWADCSAFATWCLWNGLYMPFGLKDIVNRQDWVEGWTGTLAQHGLRVPHGRWIFRGDLVLYGRGAPYEHVAVVAGHDKNRKPLVISHGSEGGPYFLPYNYRSDVGEIRRYI